MFLGEVWCFVLFCFPGVLKLYHHFQELKDFLTKALMVYQNCKKMTDIISEKC